MVIKLRMIGGLCLPSVLALLRGTIVNRTYGTQKPIHSPIFSTNIWSYLLWPPVIVVKGPP